MPDISISALTEIGAPPSGASSAPLSNGASSQQPGSFLGMMQDILRPTPATSEAESPIPSSVRPGKAGRLTSPGKISQLLAPISGAPLAGAKLDSDSAPSAAGVPVTGCLATLIRPEPQSLSADTVGEPTGAGDPAKQPNTANTSLTGISERAVSRPPLTFDPATQPAVGIGASGESSEGDLFAPVGVLQELSEASNKLDQQIPITIASVEVPKVGHSDSTSAHIGAMPAVAQLSSILEQVGQLQRAQLGVPPAVVAIASKAAAHSSQSSPLATSRSATDLSGQPGARAPRLKPTPSEATTDAARAIDPSAKASTRASSSRGNTQEETGSHDRSTPADSAHPASDDAVADKSSSFSQVFASSHEAAGSALNAVTAQAAPVAVGTGAKPASAGLTNPPTPSAVSPPPNTQPKDFGHVISDAQLGQSATHSEMRIAMQTDRLGAVELRAHVTGDGVGAAITVEKRDAHAALAAELPALQQALSEKHLRVDQLHLMQGALNSTAHDAGAQQQEQPRKRQAHLSAFGASQGQGSAFASGDSEQTMVFDSNGRLSVRA